MSAALTPRVRVLAICDEATASAAEDGVYSLDGVRYEVYAPALPYRHSLFVYLLLTSPCVGIFDFRIRLLGKSPTWEVEYAGLRVGFAEENELVAIDVNLGEIEFLEAGNFTVQVLFDTTGGTVVKGEQPFRVQHQHTE